MFSLLVGIRKTHDRTLKLHRIAERCIRKWTYLRVIRPYMRFRIYHHTFVLLYLFCYLVKKMLHRLAVIRQRKRSKIRCNMPENRHRHIVRMDYHIRILRMRHHGRNKRVCTCIGMIAVQEKALSPYSLHFLKTHYPVPEFKLQKQSCYRLCYNFIPKEVQKSPSCTIHTVVIVCVYLFCLD